MYKRERQLAETCTCTYDRAYTVKKVSNFSVPGRVNYFRPGRVWLVTSRLGTGKIANNFFTVYDKIIRLDG
jgi:hypothetical protein